MAVPILETPLVGKPQLERYHQNLTSKMAADIEAAASATYESAVSYIDAAISSAASDLASLESRVGNAESAIEVLNGNAETENSVEYKINSAINTFAEKVTEDGTINTIAEVISYIATHGSEYADLVAGLSAAEGNIENLSSALSDLTSLVGELPSEAAAATVVDYISEAVNAASDDLTSTISALESRVSDVETYAASISTYLGTFDSATYSEASTVVDFVNAAVSVAQENAISTASEYTDIQVSNLSEYVGQLPAGISASTVVDYVNEMNATATSAVDSLATYVGTFDSNTYSATTVVDYVAELVASTASDLSSYIDTAISSVTEYIGSVPSEAGASTVVGYIDETALSINTYLGAYDSGIYSAATVVDYVAEYADSLASNYDPAGTGASEAAAALSSANAYTDSQISAVTFITNSEIDAMFSSAGE